MGAAASSSQGSLQPPPHSPGNPVLSPSTPPLSHPLSPEERAILWEVNLAQRCVDNFSKIINAHAIVMSLLVSVTFVGVLQPPKGWNVDPQTLESYMFASSAVLGFTVFNSLALYSAISGLLFYIYCSYSTIFTLGSVPIPDRFDTQGVELIRQLRRALRRVALPSVKRRSTVLFCFLASSLFFCVGAYICAGLAAAGHSKSTLAVIVPAILGCIPIVFLLLLAWTKMSMELKFDERLRVFWTSVQAQEPQIGDLDEETTNALDPMPKILKTFVNVVWRVKQLPVVNRINGK